MKECFHIDENAPEFGNGMRAELGHADVLYAVRRAMLANDGDSATQYVIASVGADILNCSIPTLLKAISMEGTL